MKPATYNLLEGIVRVTITIAETSLSKDALNDLRDDLHEKLMSVKNEMRREEGEDLVQATAKAVLALARHTLGFKVNMDSERVQKKHLLSAVKDLAKRSEDRHKMTEATLHPTGRCTCAGEHTCEWCDAHCIECGMALFEDGRCPNCYEDGEALAKQVLSSDKPCALCGEPESEHDPRHFDHGFEANPANVATKDPEEGLGCAMCGVPRREHVSPDATHRWVDPANMVTKAPEEPVIENKIDLGVDKSRWKVITDMSGEPSVALYINGRKDSLSQEQIEQLEEAILPIIAGWGR